MNPLVFVIPDRKFDPDCPRFRKFAEDVRFKLIQEGILKTEAGNDDDLESKSERINEARKDEEDLESKSERINEARKDEEDLESKSERINESGKDEDLENGIGKIDYMDCRIVFEPWPDYYMRQNRARDAQRFTNRYKFKFGQKFCIHPCGPPISCFSDYCFDSTWVGVHGMQSICIVTRPDMDMTRLADFYQKECMKRQNMRMFARAAICEVECLPHKEVEFYDVAFRRSCTGAVQKPFAVVSMGEGPHEEFPYEGSKPLGCCIFKTIGYLESVVSSDMLHTHYGIIEVAIKAYQLMCYQELRADDISVTIMDFFEPPRFDYLPMDIIGEQLDLVNGLSSEKVPQKPLFVHRGGNKPT